VNEFNTPGYWMNKYQQLALKSRNKIKLTATDAAVFAAGIAAGVDADKKYFKSLPLQ
jgi:hypothetical protein